METIVIAGGSGMIGSALATYWRNAGHTVRVLSRKPTNAAKHQFNWDASNHLIDEEALVGCTILINLSGEGIAEKRWTEKRKHALYDSRIKTTEFLHSLTPKMALLKHYISASGVTCYGFDNGTISHPETNPFGPDYTSQLVKSWESSAQLFSSKCLVTSIRIGVVLSAKGGALPKLITPIKLGIGSPIGTGKQAIPWIQLDDLVGVFNHLMTHQLGGIYNANAGNTTNEELTNVIAKTLDKKLWMPKVPGFAIYLIFGRMSDLILKGAKADNRKLVESGFQFENRVLERAVANELEK